jgi:hypothetical protein
MNETYRYSIHCNMRTIITVIIALFVKAGPVFAQVDVANQNLNTTISQSRQFYGFDARLKNVIGSPKLFKEYLPGKLIGIGGRHIQVDAINFDAYNGDVLFKKDGKEIIAPEEQINGFVVKDREQADSIKFTKLKFESKPAFYRVLANHKKVALYRRYIKVLDRPSATDGYSHNETDTKILDREKLVLWNGEEFAEFKTKKQLLQYFPDEKAELETFIKQENIDFKNDTDLVKLFGKISELKGT